MIPGVYLMFVEDKNRFANGLSVTSFVPLVLCVCDHQRGGDDDGDDCGRHFISNVGQLQSPCFLHLFLFPGLQLALLLFSY